MLFKKKTYCFFFFAEKKKKGLAGAFIVPTHLNPILTWRGAHLGNNGAYHYPNPQLGTSLQVNSHIMETHSGFAFSQ
jgi:hypothetical protein